MRKIWKYILLVFVLLVVSLGGYGVYIFKFKEYDVADPKVDEIIDGHYIIELPDGTNIEIDKDGNVVQENQQTTDNNESSNQNGTVETTKSNSPNEEQSTSPDEAADTKKDNNTVISDSKPTVASIKEKYKPALNALEAQATSRLSGLLSSAASEYSRKKAAGENIDVGYFYNKYSNAALNLEASTDVAFYALISVIEKELQANGFAKSHVQSFIDTYEAAKGARSEAILGKVKELM